MCCSQPTRDEECVVCVSGRVLLGLEQAVEVPEAALDEVVGRHLCEPGERESFITCVARSAIRMGHKV